MAEANPEPQLRPQDGIFLEELGDIAELERDLDIDQTSLAKLEDEKQENLGYKAPDWAQTLGQLATSDQPHTLRAHDQGFVKRFKHRLIPDDGGQHTLREHTLSKPFRGRQPPRR